MIDKPAGITSHDVVSRVRRSLGTRRVGHAGTLDPIATGLLVVAVGHATRFLNYLPLEPKRYEGVARFGVATATYDSEGEPTETRPIPEDLEERIGQVGERFVGAVRQLPPMFSAVKKDGRPLYEYARKGVEVEREEREVWIDALDVEVVPPDRARICVVCSGGTYVRTLVHDLGQAVGCGAHVVELRRTQVGRFRVEEAIAQEEASPERLIPLSEALDLPMARLTEPQLRLFRNGNPVRMRLREPSPHAAVCDLEGNVVGLARCGVATLEPEIVIPSDAPGR
ncbi:MAG: tRNA pseudouridine(55) synthase TruB [Fimbriimonadales bacterium]|nr:tRNA pseudouridine(55) synthase TruB [Fimbriimonadales bacterium]